MIHARAADASLYHGRVVPGKPDQHTGDCVNPIVEDSPRLLNGVSASCQGLNEDKLHADVARWDRESLIKHITKAMEALQRRLALEAKKR